MALLAKARKSSGIIKSIAAGTQAFVLIPMTFVLRMDTEASFTWGMALGWAVNIGAAEWLLHRRTRRARAITPSAR